MIALVGYVAILIAFVSAVALTIQGWRVSRTSTPDPSRIKLPVIGLAGGGVAAFLLLEIGILTHDFSIAYVAKNTALATPFVFLLAAGWAALAGSVVLWGLMLSVFTWLVWRTVKSGDGLGILALGVMGAVSVFWFGLMATAANPFEVCTDVVNGFCATNFVVPNWASGGSIGGYRAESAAREPHLDGGPSATALRWLCRIHRSLRVRYRRPDPIRNRSRLARPHPPLVAHFPGSS